MMNHSSALNDTLNTWTRLAWRTLGHRLGLALAGIGLTAVLVSLSLPPRAIADDSPAPGEEAIGQRPPDDLLTPESLAEGRHTFYVHCAACHGTEGWAGTCPNLADEVTLHGGRYADILATVTRGVEETEMPRWFGKLEFNRIMQVAAYVYTLKGTHVPKTPEGRQLTARRRATMYTPPPPGEPAKPTAAPQ